MGIFPEGSRGAGSLQAVKAGVAWLALNSGHRWFRPPALGRGRREPRWDTSRSAREAPRGLREPIALPDLPKGRVECTQGEPSDWCPRGCHGTWEDAVALTGLALPGDAELEHSAAWGTIAR